MSWQTYDNDAGSDMSDGSLFLLNSFSFWHKICAPHIPQMTLMTELNLVMPWCTRHIFFMYLIRKTWTINSWEKKNWSCSILDINTGNETFSFKFQSQSGKATLKEWVDFLEEKFGKPWGINGNEDIFVDCVTCTYYVYI